MSLVRNMPCELGQKVGEMIATFADAAAPEYAADFARRGMPVPQRCRTCALRLGTHANSCLTTTADALKCAMEYVDFCCHEKAALTPDGPQICVGWAMLVMESAKRRSEPVKMPWSFSDEQPEIPSHP